MISHGGGIGAKDDSLRFLLHLDPIQALHVVAATAWIAGVVWVAIAFRDPTRGAAAARRFRTPAVGLLAIVVITGFRNAIPHFRFGSTWSWVLLGKVALVAGAVGLGARFRARIEAGVLGVVAALGLFLGATVPATPLATVLISSPAHPSAACAQVLRGARVAAAAVGGAVKTFRGNACGVTNNGVVDELDWAEAGRVGATSLAKRGVTSARVIGEGPAFARGVRDVLPDGDDAVFVLSRASLTSVPAGPRPVVLAPWLLDAATLEEASERGLSVLVAAQRDLTDNLAIDYRDAASRAGVTPSAAGLEGFVSYLAAVGGGGATRPQAGLYAVSTLGVMPPELGHGHGDAGWAPDVALIRL